MGPRPPLPRARAGAGEEARRGIGSPPWHAGPTRAWRSAGGLGASDGWGPVGPPLTSGSGRLVGAWACREKRVPLFLFFLFLFLPMLFLFTLHRKGLTISGEMTTTYAGKNILEQFFFVYVFNFKKIFVFKKC